MKYIMSSKVNSSSVLESSIGRKLAMALSGFFLMFFLFQHFAINSLSLFSPKMFNEVSHFMGTNPLVQFLLQPVLIFGVIFHLAMGIYLDLLNKKARPTNYSFTQPSSNSSWMSRNMIITGITVMLFLVLHFYDFWVHEIVTKYVVGDMSGIHNGEYRYFKELQAKFVDPIRVLIYVVSFVFLSLHLLHGFQSSFQSVGFNHKKYTPTLKKLGNLFAIFIPLGFAFIAIYHYIKSL
jgi:succinate dehydrogenase / fumarate reductase cytochrome b subunit